MVNASSPGDPTGAPDVDPTMPLGPVGGEYEFADEGGYGQGGPPTVGGTGGGTSPGGRSWYLWWMIAGVFVVGAAIGIVIALASNGGDGKPSKKPNTPSSTTTSSSTTSTTVPATTTTTTPGPVITSFTTNPGSPVPCGGPLSVTFSWSTQNSVGVTITVDGAGTGSNFSANGSAQLTYPCDGTHSYTLTARAQDGRTATVTLSLAKGAAPTTTAPTTTPATTTSTTR